MSHFTIAGMQLAVRNGDNLDYIVQEITSLLGRFPWIDMIVLSELATFGADTDAPDGAAASAETAYRELAARHRIWLLPGSFYVQRDGQIFNELPVIDPRGTIITRYAKMFPFYPYESGITAGREFCVFDVPGTGRFGVSICYDKWFPETSRTLAWLGAEVILHPTLTTTIDRDVELAMSRSSAACNQVYFFDINAAGPFGFGRSVVCDPGGRIIHEASAGQEVFPVEIDLQEVRRVRERGWHGTCQVLKSFRDNTVEFPPYQPSRNIPECLEDLGEIRMPSGSKDR